MKKLFLPALVFILLSALSLAVAGCGKTSATQTVTRSVTVPPRAPFVCHPRHPAEGGECIRQELEYDGITPAAPELGATFGAARHGQCIDISRYQPYPAFRELAREGIICVIVQGADDGSESNPYFDSQVRSAHEAGLQVGVYVFAEGDVGFEQADALERVAAPERSRITLGAWVDTEVPSAYPKACAIAEVLRRSFYIVGDYGSPGTVPAWMNYCGMLDYPAEWGGGPAYPAPGFSSASVKLRQWCGTCQLVGVGEVDRDEDLGVIALSHPKPRPKPKPKPTHAQLEAYLRALDALLGAHTRADPHGHNCASPPYHHAYPSARYDPACEQWAHEAAATRRALR